MMRPLRVVAALVALAPLALGACSEKTPPPLAGEEQLAMKVDNVIIGLEHIMTSNGVRSAHLVADTAYVVGDSMELAKPRIQFYDAAGGQSGDLIAKRGFMNSRTRLMTVTGQVVLNVQQGSRRIESEELHYDPEGDRLWSDKPTVSREGSSVLRGTGFTSNTKFTNLQVINPQGTGLKFEF